MLNFRQLRYFCEIMESGSSAAAAERLHVAPTALSMQVSQLEEELGGELFNRARRPMKPTALGRYLYPRAREILGTTARLEDDARSLAAGRTGWIAIGYTRSSIFSVLPRAARLFRSQYPKVHLELLTMLSEHQPDHLLSGRIQVGLCRFVGEPPASPSVTYTRLFDDALYLAVPTGHPFCGRDMVSAGELGEIQLVTYPRNVESAFTNHALALLRDAGASPSVAHEAPEIHTALGLVASGLGCALVGGSIRPGSRRDVAFTLIADLPPNASTVFAATRSDESGLVVPAFLRALIAVGQELGNAP